MALDTSVAIPLLADTHQEHGRVRTWARGRELRLSGHALVETYSVLTRLPGDMRVSGEDALALLERNFGEPLQLSQRMAFRVPAVLAKCGVVGAATYDGLVALAAREHGAVLATRDARALPTYDAVGARVLVL